MFYVISFKTHYFHFYFLFQKFSGGKESCVKDFIIGRLIEMGRSLDYYTLELEVWMGNDNYSRLLVEREVWMRWWKEIIVLITLCKGSVVYNTDGKYELDFWTEKDYRLKDCLEHGK